MVYECQEGYLDHEHTDNVVQKQSKWNIFKFSIKLVPIYTVVSPVGYNLQVVIDSAG